MKCVYNQYKACSVLIENISLFFVFFDSEFN